MYIFPKAHWSAIPEGQTIDISNLFEGLLIGAILAAPVGPISLICIRRTLNGGRLHGIASGLGIATGDVFYAAVAMLGLTAISGFIIANQVIFKLLACLVLIVVGILVATASLPARREGCGAGTYLRDYLSMAGVTISNPLTILFVIGIFAGSVIWWVTLSMILGSGRFRSDPGWIRFVNRVSGVFIFTLGTVSLLYFVLVPG